MPRTFGSLGDSFVDINSILISRKIDNLNLATSIFCAIAIVCFSLVYLVLLNLIGRLEMWYKLTVINAWVHFCLGIE